MRMTVEQARAYAQALLAAADKATAEGRTVLLESDLDSFAALDDGARAELDAAIARAEKA